MRLLPLLLLATQLAAAEIRVFAAASLTEALQEVAAGYERETGDRVLFNFAGSSTLARQIELGAPADLFLSADEAKMDGLQKRGLVDVRTRASVLSNALVIVGDGIRSPRDLIGKKLALAEPSTVPAGIYAKTWLVKSGLWPRVAPNVIPTDNVRAALAAVEAGNADAAIVYRTDTRRPAFVIRDGPPISYPFAVLTGAEQPRAARRFLAYAQSEAGLRVFRKHGFLIVAAGRRQASRRDGGVPL